MNSCLRRAASSALLVALIASATPSLRGADDDSLAKARDLYSAASYEDALVLLNRLRSANHGADDGRAVEQYRAFCLLALGRSDDAEQAIEAVVAAEPSYQPSDADVSPRIRSAFSDVRRRMLPSIIQQKYLAAKAAFDRKEFAVAEATFTQVLNVLADSDVGAAANQPPLSDIRTLASGFRDLSAKAAAPPPPPVAVAAPPPVAPTPPPAPTPPRIYGPEDANVVPPAIVRQTLPPFQYQMQTALPPQGSVEVVIDEKGTVETAIIRRSIVPKYDTQVLEAARGWQYKPATLNGVPVKYRKTVGISITRTR